MSEYAQILALGIFIGLVIFLVLANIHSLIVALRRGKSKLTLDNVRQKDLCKQPHNWMKVYLAAVGYGEVNMCRVCGYIAGSKLMASQEMIDRLEHLEHKQKVEDQLYKEFSKIEDHYIQRHFEKEIESGVDLNKLIDLHQAGQTFEIRFKAYLLQESAAESKKKDV